MFTEYIKMEMLGEADEPVVGRVTDGGRRYLVRYKTKTFRVDIINGKHRVGDKMYDDKGQAVAAIVRNN